MDKVARRRAEREAAKRKAEKEANEQVEREVKERAEKEAREKAERGAKEQERGEGLMTEDKRIEREKVEREAKEKTEREAKEREEQKKAPTLKIPSAWGLTVGKNDRSRKTFGLSLKEQKNEWAGAWDLGSTEDVSDLPPVPPVTAGLFDVIGNRIGG